MQIGWKVKECCLGLLLLVCLGVNCFAAERYAIDPEHTGATFEYDHWGLSLQHGRFDSTSGFIEMDIAEKTGIINIEIATASVSTGTEAFDKILRSADYFNALEHPKISFTSSALRFDQERLTQVAGAATVNGITRPVTLEITHFNCRFMVIIGKRTCGANAYAKILRSEFKLGRHVPFVSDAVTLFVRVEAIKQ